MSKFRYVFKFIARWRHTSWGETRQSACFLFIIDTEDAISCWWCLHFSVCSLHRPRTSKRNLFFLILQSGGLKDPKDPAFKRYFYLLENLAYVKSFNMCFDVEYCQEIFCELFKLIFKIVK